MRRPEPTALCRRGLTRTFQQARVFGSLTLVENMVAVGKTPSQLARDMESVLAEYVRSPKVNVIVTAPASSTPFGYPLLLLCSCLGCPLLVSGAGLAVVLYRRSRRQPPGGVS